MVRITIDEEMRKKLLSSGEIVELCDESGAVIGRVTPRNPKLPPEWAKLADDFTEDELRQSRDYEGPAMTTAELIAYLHRKR